MSEKIINITYDHWRYQIDRLLGGDLNCQKDDKMQYYCNLDNIPDEGFTNPELAKFVQKIIGDPKFLYHPSEGKLILNFIKRVNGLESKPNIKIVNDYFSSFYHKNCEVIGLVNTQLLNKFIEDYHITDQDCAKERDLCKTEFNCNVSGVGIKIGPVFINRDGRLAIVEITEMKGESCWSRIVLCHATDSLILDKIPGSAYFTMQIGDREKRWSNIFIRDGYFYDRYNSDFILKIVDLE